MTAKQNVSTKPSIVLFMVDQLSAKWLEAAGAGTCPIPNVDRLGASGVSFTNAFTSNPVCQPARSTIATGLATRGHGVLENGYRLDPALPTFMQALQQDGWRTGALGKVHFHPHFAGVRPDYKPYGLDVTHITEDPRGGEWLDWVQQNHPEHYEAALATIWAVRIPDFAAYGPKKVNLVPRIEEIRKNFQWSSEGYEGGAGTYVLPFPEEVSQTAWITQHGVDFIRRTPADRPLFAQVSYVQPHSPFCPPAAFMPKVNVEKIPQMLPAEWLEDPHRPKSLAKRRPVGPEHQKARRFYFADICHLDEQLGKVMAELEQAARLDNTYVILLADHGEMLGDHGCVGKEDPHYDSCIRVPLIIAGPGLKKGLICDQMVQLEDICPTVLEMAGLSLPPVPTTGPYLRVPAEEIPQLPGRSLLALCRGQQPGDWRTAAYSESYDRISTYNPSYWGRTIRTKRWRYTYYPAGGEQLFDMANDPDEQTNLAGDQAHAAAKQELRDQLMELVVMQDYPKTRRELFAMGVH